jgi:Tfp pilus assembly protein PilV
MVVLALLAIGFVSAAGLQTRAVVANSAARRATHACQLAAVRMEKLMALPFDAQGLQDRNQNGLAGLDAVSAESADGSDAGNPPYTVFWNVARVPRVFDPTTINYKQLRVVATWKERGALRRLPLTCFRSDG